MDTGITLGLIPARGGSKGIRKKNIRSLFGKPLIAYSIECGLACPSIDKLIVSTDDLEIASIAKEWGADVPFMRPSELARDETPMLPVMQHALQSAENFYNQTVNTLILLDPTSPLRTIQDIENALMILRRNDSCQAVISGCRAHRHPSFSMVRLENDFAQLVMETDKELGRRQDCPPVYDLDSTVWVYSREALMDIRQRIPPRTRLYLVPEERSSHIDSEMDFRIIEFLMAQKTSF